MGGTQVPVPPSPGPCPGGVGGGEPSPIRVMIAKDVAVVRETLAALLGLEPGIEVAVAPAASDQIVSAALKHRPDVALLDIGLPGVGGLTASAELARRLPGCRVLIVTGLEAPGNLHTALHAGVCGFLVQDGPTDELINAVRGRWPAASGSSTPGWPTRRPAHTSPGRRPDRQLSHRRDGHRDLREQVEPAIGLAASQAPAGGSHPGGDVGQTAARAAVRTRPFGHPIVADPQP